ncbi:MAG: hypothetical protein QF380_09025 [Candidatus Marinimicrobia bacterium]|nr:hypothetical protein [Candidatus Neomarinimicrobiota bacterium]
MLIINRATDKILKFIKEISEKGIDDITIIINSGNLEKKSKLRIYFEKEKNTICIPFYNDEVKTLNFLAYNFLKNNKGDLGK